MGGYLKQTDKRRDATTNKMYYTLSISMSFLDLGPEPEKVYHAFVMGLFLWLSPDYEVKSNRESGYAAVSRDGRRPSALATMPACPPTAHVGQLTQSVLLLCAEPGSKRLGTRLFTHVYEGTLSSIGFWSYHRTPLWPRVNLVGFRLAPKRLSEVERLKGICWREGPIRSTGLLKGPRV